MASRVLPSPAESSATEFVSNYQLTVKEETHKTNRLSELFQRVTEPLGILLRNTFYLTRYRSSVPEMLVKDENVSTDMVNNSSTSCLYPASLEVQEMCRSFSIHPIEVCIKKGSLTSVFHLRLFQSKNPIDGKILKLFLFCFNGNEQSKTDQNQRQRWEPKRLEELTKSPLLVLQALQPHHRVTALITNSLGNVIYDKLQHFSEKLNHSFKLPQDTVICRGMTSSRKVANKILFFPLNYICYFLGKITGWAADPENGLLDFFKKNPTQRPRVTMIEAQDDYFFSGKGAPDPNIHIKLKDLGIPNFRAKFWPNVVHPRAHHALSLDHFENNCETQLCSNTSSFELDRKEKLPSALAKNLFFKGQEHKTFFWIAGADSTLNTATIRDVLPFLTAVKTEAKKSAIG